ncbi:MAG TPA: YdcF family protein [Spirochaetota bacterium]|nr:YdcF family protein [Spirochaetota bacterium]HPJ42199.1 YdcF family protein [Spirochaetota bacterium]HPR37864.1 YdcF family protein [Spirochaetota bacterium]HRX48954.1 YdcF family protein [Spirochaetota bacterium]
MKKFSIYTLALLMVYMLAFILLESHAAQNFSGYEKHAGQDIDALVVFFGDFDDNGNISEESVRRLTFAVDLYKKGAGENIIFVGGWRPLQNLYGSAMMAKRAEEMGVKPSDIFYDLRSRDTINNWLEAEKIIKKQNFKKVVLVSSAFHLMRIEKMIDIGDDISASYAAYKEDCADPSKSLLDSFSEYNYNVASMLTYLVFPAGLYRATIGKLRN